MWKFWRPKKNKQKPLLYSDVFEVMHYTSSVDVMPYPIGIRAKGVETAPDGEDTHFALLDSKAEVAEFQAMFDGEAEVVNGNEIHIDQLLAWNNKPSRLASDVALQEFSYPLDETKNWPFMVAFALPFDAFKDASLNPKDYARNRYHIHTYAPEQREEVLKNYHEMMAERTNNSMGPNIFVNGAIPYETNGVFNLSCSEKKH